MPLDYRLAMAQPQEPFGTLKNILDFGQVHDQERAKQEQRQAEQIIQQTLQQFPDKPDEAVTALRRVGQHKAADEFELHLTKVRKAKLDERGAMIDQEYKLGQIDEQRAKAEKAAIAAADPMEALPFVAMSGSQEDYDNGLNLIKLKFGPKADALIAQLPPQWSPEVSTRLSNMLLGPKGAAEVANQKTDNDRMALQAEQAKHAAEMTAADRLADNERMAAAAAETARHNKAMEGLGQGNLAARKAAAAQGGASSSTGGTSTNAKDIAKAIMNGTQPPETTGLYGQTAAVKGELSRAGYDLTRAQEDWNATKKYLQTINGAQQIRLRQAVTFTRDSLDIVQGLADEWKGSGFPLMNKAQLALAKQGAMGAKAQSLANRMDAQISDIVSELGTVYKGGNSSTDESLKLAAKNLQSDWSQKTMTDAINLIRKNLTIRENSIKLGQPIGGREENPYAPTRDQPAAGAIPEGTERQVPGHPGVIAVYRGGRWVVK